MNQALSLLTPAGRRVLPAVRPLAGIPAVHRNGESDHGWSSGEADPGEAADVGAAYGTVLGAMMTAQRPASARTVGDQRVGETAG